MSPGGHGLNISLIKEKLLKYVKGGMYNINKPNTCITKKKRSIEQLIYGNPEKKPGQLLVKNCLWVKS